LKLLHSFLIGQESLYMYFSCNNLHIFISKAPEAGAVPIVVCFRINKKTGLYNLPSNSFCFYGLFPFRQFQHWCIFWCFLGFRGALFCSSPYKQWGMLLVENRTWQVLFAAGCLKVHCANKNMCLLDKWSSTRYSRSNDF
jgi:hypothetical protein